jgi:hypothetical protein
MPSFREHTAFRQGRKLTSSVNLMIPTVTNLLRRIDPSPALSNVSNVAKMFRNETQQSHEDDAGWLTESYRFLRRRLWMKHPSWSVNLTRKWYDRDCE